MILSLLQYVSDKHATPKKIQARELSLFVYWCFLHFAAVKEIEKKTIEQQKMLFVWNSSKKRDSTTIFFDFIMVIKERNTPFRWHSYTNVTYLKHGILYPVTSFANWFEWSK